MVCITVHAILVLVMSMSSVSADCETFEKIPIDKKFRQDLLGSRIYFPIGQKLTIVPSFSSDSVPYPEVNDDSHPRCFSMTIKHPIDIQGHSEITKVPFNCVTTVNQPLFCHLNTKGTKDTDHEVPLNLWGTATPVKTDNQTYILVVTCQNDNQSWILLHKEASVGQEFVEAIVNHVRTLHLTTFDYFDSTNRQKVTLLYMDMEPKCPKEWPQQNII